MAGIDSRIQALIKNVTAKRARVVIDHIVKHGHITTDDLADYGYEHPPRAARDVREHGIPLATFRTKGRAGRSIAAYKFGNPGDIQEHKLGGRQVLSKELHRVLFEQRGGHCFACWSSYEDRYLTIDHRVPYEIAGEIADQSQVDEFMLLCGSCQRKKSWSCEHCRNWTDKDEATCRACLWAIPDGYSHVAMEVIRRIEVTFRGAEVDQFDRFVAQIREQGLLEQDVLRELFLSESILKRR